MSSPGNGAIGSLEYSSEERKILAKKSRNWECSECGKVVNLLSTSKCDPITQEESDLINRIALKAEDTTKKNLESNKREINVENVLVDSSNEKETSMHSKTISKSSAPDMNPASFTDFSENNNNLSNNNNNFRGLIWFVVGAIILLIARRLFLLWNLF